MNLEIADASKFYDQFKTFRPALIAGFNRNALDNFIYAHGVEMLNRTAGCWKAVKVGNVWSLMLGEGDVPLTPITGKVSVLNILSGDRTDTDAVTASVAFTLLATNWWWHTMAGVLTEAEHDTMMKFYDGLRDGMWADSFPVNQRDLFNLTD